MVHVVHDRRRATGKLEWRDVGLCGSILGPVVFVFINMDIPSIPVNCIGYADDNSNWEFGKLIDELCTYLAGAASRLIDLSTELKLSLNPQKTQLLWVGGSALAGLPEVQVRDIAIKPSNTIEILGLELDRKFSPAP